MSGPVSADDVGTAPEVSRATEREVLLEPGRRTSVGDVPVRRVLPQRPRRTVGAWCFADHMGPVRGQRRRTVSTSAPIRTWASRPSRGSSSGEVLHRDSLGSEQLVRAGQLNLMTAGRGVAHAEENTGRFQGELQGIQLWVAQPEATRHGAAAFEHHAELPLVELGGLRRHRPRRRRSPARSPQLGATRTTWASTSSWTHRARFSRCGPSASTP